MSEEKANKPEQKKRSGKKKRKIIRRLITLVLVLGILGLGGFIAVRKLQADYRITYDPYTASIGSIANSLSYSGSMQLINTTTYTASSECKVREVYVSAGDRVKEGDKLVRLSDGTTVTADFDGKVNKVEVEKGDEVRGNANLVQVVDFDHMRVSFRVGESDIRQVSPGASVRVTVSSVSAAFDAQVSTIDYSSYSGNNVAYYTATVDVDTSSLDYIYPGMQATVTIPQEEAKDVVILKMDAVSTAADNTAFVYKQQEDGTMAEVPVAVGVSNGNYVEIKAGVSDGETVYVVRKQEENTVAGILSGIFGSQQVNRPSGNFPGRENNSNWQRPSGGGTNSNNPGSRRGN